MDFKNILFNKIFTIFSIPYIYFLNYKKKYQLNYRIKKSAPVFYYLYDNLNTHEISKKARYDLNIQNDPAYTYGEIDFLSFLLLLEEANPISGEIFYDLGSGAGKAVLAAALCYDFSECIGIEYLPALHKIAIEKLKYIKNTRPELIKNTNIYFLEQDFLNNNLKNNLMIPDVSKANIIFINATGYQGETWDKLLAKLLTVCIGTRIMITSKRFNLPEFRLCYQAMHLMSWGMCSVFIYKKIA